MWLASILNAIAWWSLQNFPETWRARGMWKPGLAAKMRCESFDVVLADAYPVTFAIVRDHAGAVAEIQIQAQGSTAKSDGGLPLIYEDLGAALSRAIQGRDPVTGEPLALAALARGCC